jgi:PAS domain S-box-containing protein
MALPCRNQIAKSFASPFKTAHWHILYVVVRVGDVPPYPQPGADSGRESVYLQHTITMREHRPQQSIDGSQISDVRKEKDYQVPDLTPCAAGAASGDLPPSAEEVRSQLACVVESWEFRKSKRSQQFLQHVVDCALRGEVERLKESVIGIELFERAPGYDAGGDSSVRVRASDVRRRLLAYYQRVGTGAHVQIGLPPGSYMPRFARLPSIPAALPDGIETGPRLAGRPFLPPADASLLRFHDGLEAVGSDSLYSLLACLTDAMRADCVYIGTVAAGDADTVKTIAVVAGGQRGENFEYLLAGSPCENVVAKTVLICPQAVQREFPNDALLQEMDAESYAGVPLFDCRGESLGLLAVLSRRPIRDTHLAKSMLEVYAGRIAAELERQAAERALDESERRYRALFESAGDAILLIRDDRFVDCNPRAVEYFGSAREQILGQTPLAFSPSCQPDGSDATKAGREKIDQALREGAVSFDWRFQRRDGSVFDANVALSRVDGFGTPHLVAHVRDVTHAREVERRIQESEGRFRAIFGSAGIGMSVLDRHGRVVESNPATQTLLGYSEAELASMAFSGYTHPDDFDSEMHLFTELIQGKRERYQMEKRYIRKDGKVVWGVLTASLLRGPSGEPRYCIRMVEDITQRKRTEQALRESEESCRRIIETAPDGIFIVAATGQVIEVNEAACRQLGHSREHLLRSRLSDIVAPSFSEKAARRLDEMASGIFETAHIRADGTEVSLEVSTCHFTFRGQAARLGIARDITERKRAEKERVSLEQQLQQAQKLEGIGRLDSGVAHA